MVVSEPKSMSILEMSHLLPSETKTSLLEIPKPS